jgi:hypothetical protein
VSQRQNNNQRRAYSRIRHSKRATVHASRNATLNLYRSKTKQGAGAHC